MDKINKLLENYVKSINECDIELAQTFWDAFLEFGWDFYATLKETNEQIHTKGRETQFLVLRDNEWKINNIHYSQEPEG